MFNKLKKFLKSKRAVGSVATAIKVVTACVLGAAILVGGVALTNDIVLPNTSDKVQNVAEYEGDGTSGSTGGVAPVSTPIASTITFTISGTEYTAEEGMTWDEWCSSAYNTGGYYCEGQVYQSPRASLYLTGNFVNPSDVILANQTYEIMLYGSGN